MAKPKAQTPAPPPTPKTIIVTKEQAESFARHQVAVQQQQQIANAVLEGIMTGHGHTNVSVIGFDAETRKITFTVPA